MMSASPTVIQIGTVAMITAAMNDGMRCSATATSPLPPSSRKMPTIAAVRHSTRRGRTRPAAGSRRRRHHAWASRKPSSRLPAMTKRMPPDRIGGSVSTTKAMAR
jgi:hypothetical protein